MFRKLGYNLFLASVGFISASTWGAAGQAPAAPRLHGLFAEHMVVQREVPLPVWGTAAPGAKVLVDLAGRKGYAVADSAGKWQARLEAVPAGGPYRLTAATSAGETVIEDVWSGDVWLCSGQSNMEWPVRATLNADAEIAAANHPSIRLFTVPKQISATPQADVVGEWQLCTPETVPPFSAVGYFFGRDLARDLNVPIGLINASWGGTFAEAWTSPEALEKLPSQRPALAQFRAEVAIWEKGGEQAYQKSVQAWQRKADPLAMAEPPPTSVAFKDAEWVAVAQPGIWEDSGLPDFDGVVWFRKEIELPKEMIGKEVLLSLGMIDDDDQTYVNGQLVGETKGRNTPRRYKLAAGVLQPGRNLLAVRVTDTSGGGGFHGDAAQMELIAEDSRYSLAGTWLRQPNPSALTAPFPKRLFNDPNRPSVLYNGMIAPLLPFPIKGVVWYQGEANAGQPLAYRHLLAAMITDWRTRFGVGEFPFGIVQLANFLARRENPGDSNWAALREAQFLVSQRLPNCGLAVAIDIGDAQDIHPRNKQEVGRRLAQWALGSTYGRAVESSGPVCIGKEIKDGTIILRFSHATGGLTTRDGGALRGFAIAGKDGAWVWADAVIQGETVVVSAAMVPQPVATRYAWADNPACNLVNQAGLPASPFRTDIPGDPPP